MILEILSVLFTILLCCILFLACFIGYATLRRRAQKRKIDASIELKRLEREASHKLVRWDLEMKRRRAAREMMDRASKARQN